MSRMTTSCASFSCARPAMRRACSSDVSVASNPSRTAKCSRLLRLSIEPERLDQLRHGRRNEAVDRLAPRDAPADVARGDRQGLPLEELRAPPPREPHPPPPRPGARGAPAPP